MYKIIDTNIIYGLQTVNNGEVAEFDLCDPINPMKPLIVEVLRPEKHNPNAQIIAFYMWDIKTCNKIEITLYRIITTGECGSEIYYFKGRNELQHHKSFIYRNFEKLPKKYKPIINLLKPCFIEIFD